MKTTYTTFTREMARAYREKRKWMTRRVMRVQPHGNGYSLSRVATTTGDRSCIGKLHWIKREGLNIIESDARYFNYLYGRPGDQLILGTTWAVPKTYDDMKPTELSPGYGFGPQFKPIPIWSYFDSDEKPEEFGKLRPGRFLPGFLRDRMPKETLKIVRVEQVQDITDEEAILEGIFETPREPGFDCWSTYGMRDYYPTPRDAFKALWDSINASRGYTWDSNPRNWALGW